MNTTAISAGARMRARREALYVSQRELASLADVAVPTVSNFEHGALPSRRRSAALDRVLAVLDELEATQPVPA